MNAPFRTSSAPGAGPGGQDQRARRRLPRRPARRVRKSSSRSQTRARGHDDVFGGVVEPRRVDGESGRNPDAPRSQYPAHRLRPALRHALRPILHSPSARPWSRMERIRGRSSGPVPSRAPGMCPGRSMIASVRAESTGSFIASWTSFARQPGSPRLFGDSRQRPPCGKAWRRKVRRHLRRPSHRTDDVLRNRMDHSLPTRIRAARSRSESP